MYNPPAYAWVLTIGGPTAIVAATCIALYSGAVRAGQGRKRAALLGGAAAVLLGGWYTATAVIAGHGWYDTRPSQVPWLPIAAAGSLGMLLALSQIPVVARALRAPGMASRLVLPQSFRVTGVFFLLFLALGHLPALFALPAGLGDIAAGIAALLVALRLARGTGRRVVQRLRPHRSGRGHHPWRPYQLWAAPRHPFHRPDQPAPARAVIAADVPLMIALHITSLVTLARTARPARGQDDPAAHLARAGPPRSGKRVGAWACTRPG